VLVQAHLRAVAIAWRGLATEHEPCHTSLLTSWFMVTKGHWAGIDPMSPSADADR